METVCPFCQSSETRLLSDTHVDNGVSYTLHECSACHGQYWTPFENPGAAWYERDERYADRNRDPILHANKKHTDIIEYLKDRKGALLDVGCGVGNFLAYAEGHGWKGWGIDFDHDAIAAGKEVLGLQNLEVADLSEFAKRHPNLRFDLITFFDVFEHIDNHIEFLEQVKTLLNPGGYIALSVPYRRAWRWLIPADVPPRHLSRWDVPSLKAVLGLHGFTVRYHNYLPASFYYMVLKFRFRYGNWTSLGLVARAKRDERTEAKGEPTPKAASRTRALELAAKAKDIVLFGIPAGIVWLVLLPTKARCTDIYLAAELNKE